MPCNRSRRGNRTYPRFDSHRGITIERVRRPAFSQETSFGRLVNCLWMLVAWALQARFKNPDVVIIGSDPILSATVAIPWKISQPSTQIVHWCFDLYPEAAVADGVLNSGLVLGVIKRTMASAYRSIDVIADIGDCMRTQLEKYSTNAMRSRLWPWALVEPSSVPIADATERERLFGRAKLGIIYSGSFGRAHSLSELLTIARLTSLKPLHFSLSICGNRIEEVHRAITCADKNISFVPFATADRLEQRLSAADIHIVSLQPEWTGTVVPSKFFGALASGRPVLFIGSEECTIAQLIRQHRLGWVCSPGEEPLIARQLITIAEDPCSLSELKAHCHRVYTEAFAREITLEAFDQELRTLLASPLPSMLIGGS